MQIVGADPPPPLLKVSQNHPVVVFGGRGVSIQAEKNKKHAEATEDNLSCQAQEKGRS